MVQDWEPRALPGQERCARWVEKGGMWLHRTVGFTRITKRRDVPIDTCDHEFWRPWKDGQPVSWSDFYTATHPAIPEGWEAGPGGWYEFVAKDEVMFGTSGVIRFWDDCDLQDRRHHAAGDRSWSVEVRRILPAIPEGWEAISEWRRYSRDCVTEYYNPPHDGVLTDTGHVFASDGSGSPGMPTRAEWYIFLRKIPPPADWGDVPRGVTLKPSLVVDMWCVFSPTKSHEGWVIYSDDTDGWTSRNPSRGDQSHPSLPAAIVALTGRRSE